MRRFFTISSSRRARYLAPSKEIKSTMNNKIELRSIGQLKGIDFFIPDYQRGYRWTQQQVVDLLNDINEFEDGDGGFYCIQPLVVVAREEDILHKIRIEAQSVEDIERLLKGSWEVVDGQQRLTTICIILKHLREEQFYNLTYGTREQFFSRLENESEADNDIDLYHMHNALKTAKKWFEDNGIDRDYYKNKLLNSVKFIWYQTMENPISVFTRLNIGKISLTNAELIKALLLNSDNHTELRPEEIAAEWDTMEYTLQDEAFWLFMHDQSYKQPTRIEYLFDIISEWGVKTKKQGKDTYKTFRYFYDYFNKEQDREGASKDVVKECWAGVKDLFHTLQEWYNDLVLYHYVGFLVETKSGNKVIPDLLKKWKEVKKKDEFIAYLKSEIKSEIGKSPLDYQYSVDGSDKRRAKSTLLFHNIQTVINQNANLERNRKYKLGVFNKFPFHLFKLESWDVEHINSNTTNPLVDEQTRKEWLLNIYISATDEEKDKIKNYFKLKDEVEAEKTQKEKLFTELLDKSDKSDKWGETEEDIQKNKNKIWNYALLDSSTNRSYGNAIFSGKRRIILNKDRGLKIPIPQLTADGIKVDEEAEKTSTFVPVCTKQIFLKYYSPSYSDSNYWTLVDAEYYLKDIKSCIDELKQPTNPENDER